MKYVKSFIYSVFILFILLASVLTFLLTTTPGLYTSIKLINLFLPGNIHVKKIAGRFINQFTFTELTYIDNKLHIKLTQGRLRWQLPTLSHPQLTIENLTANHLLIDIKNIPKTMQKTAEPITQKLPFNLYMKQVTVNDVQIQQMSVFQQFKQLKLQATVNNKQWTIEQLTTHLGRLRLTLQATGKPQAPYPLSATVHVAPLSKTQGLRGDITLTGDLNLYRWQGQFNGPVNGNLHGTLKNGFELDAKANWHDAKWPIQSTTILQSSQGNATIKGTLLDAMITAKTHIKSPIQAEWQITAHIKNKQAEVNSIFQTLEGPLITTITAKATLYNAQKAKLALTINPGTYQLPPQSPTPNIAFQGGTLLINITPDALQGTGVLTVDPHKIVNVALRIPKFRLNEMGHSRQKIDGKVTLFIDSLNFLQGVSKGIENPKGQMQFNLSAKGTFTHPLLKGELSLTNASLSLPKTGLTFSPIQAKLVTSNNHWQAQGSITSDGQALLIKGQGEFSPNISGLLNIQGDNFRAMNTSEYMINLSPQLAIHFNSTSLHVSGNILVPAAELKPLSFSNTVNLSEDMVFVSKDTTPTSPFKMTTDVEIKMGQNVNLDVKGLHGFLDGALRVKQLPNSTLNTVGSLTIRDGTYRAYGQDLIIEQGQLLFTNGFIDNPNLQIRAIRKFNNTPSNAAGSNSILNFNSGSLDTIDVSAKTIVGIEVSGRLNAHKITLFSIPPSLSQADILSMLILGKPASQASKSGGQLLMAAISSMNLDSGKKGMQLLSQLKQTLGVDFNVQNNSLYNQKTSQVSDNTALVVSKSLSKRIYISYNIGLLQPDSNVLTLKYLLNKFFSVQVNTSDSGTGIDLLYTHGKD